MITIIGALLGIVALFVFFFAKVRGFKPTAVPFLAVGALVLILLGSSYTIVPTGYTGVRTTFGQVSEQTVSKGIHFKRPFIDKITLVNNKQQDITIDSKIWGETKEKTPVYATDVVITYQVSESSSSWLYCNVSDVRHLVDDKIVASALKSAMVELTVETVTNRSYVEPLAQDKLQEALNQKYGENALIVKTIVINDMDFEESYNQAIAEKSIATQNRQRQEIENETAIAKAEADKQVAVANAEAAAEAKRIATEAEANAMLIKADAEAEANRKLSESLDENVIRNKTIEKWDGALPFVSGEASPIISIGE